MCYFRFYPTAIGGLCISGAYMYVYLFIWHFLKLQRFDEIQQIRCHLIRLNCRGDREHNIFLDSERRKDEQDYVHNLSGTRQYPQAQIKVLDGNNLQQYATTPQKISCI